jgi:hypothetical protein
MCVGAVAAAPATADDDDKHRTPSVVTSAFGAGLNTLGSGGPSPAENHVILPKRMKIKKNGVVNFVVSGFHQIAVYEPGTKPEDIDTGATVGPLIDDPNGRIFLGQSPVAPVDDFSNARNRVEGVSFREGGTFLVICTVGSHFADGMYAYVKVKSRKRRRDDDDD